MIRRQPCTSTQGFRSTAVQKHFSRLFVGTQSALPTSCSVPAQSIHKWPRYSWQHTCSRPHYERSPALRLHAMPLWSKHSSTAIPFCLPKSVHVHTFSGLGFQHRPDIGFFHENIFRVCIRTTSGMKLNINNFPFSHEFSFFREKRNANLGKCRIKWNRLPPRRFRSTRFTR